MAGLAVLAKEMGYKVSGCDMKFYPPMSHQLKFNEIYCIEGFEVANLNVEPDLWIVGNVATRGMPIVEKLISEKKKFMSGPEFLSKNILIDRPVIAVAGTHGKTTVTSIIAWLLECAGMNPGFLIGGVPQNFGISARIGQTSSPFVIEADEYDTAFFDKRSKFLHYAADYVVLNNLEFDHADIFDNLDDIKKQFHHWIRTLSKNAVIYSNYSSNILNDLLKEGTWSDVKYFNKRSHISLDWSANKNTSCFEIFKGEKRLGLVNSPLTGEHNASNFLGSFGIASEFGLNFKNAVAYFQQFKGVKRRLELVANVSGIKVYDDFAHHPTAIRKTIEGLTGTPQKNLAKIETKRLIVVFEPRSNSLKLGVGKQQLYDSFEHAHMVYVYNGSIKWDIKSVLNELGEKVYIDNNLENILEKLLSEVKIGDDVVFMSNGDFQGILPTFVKMLTAEEGC